MPEHVDRCLRRQAPEQPDREQPGVVHDVAEHGHAVLGRRPDDRGRRRSPVVAPALGQVAVVIDVPARELSRETGQVVGQPDHQGVRWLRIRLRVLGPRSDRQQQRRQQQQQQQ